MNENSILFRARNSWNFLKKYRIFDIPLIIYRYRRYFSRNKIFVLKLHWKIIKIWKFLNLCNSEDNHFRSIDEIRLKARNLTLWNVLSFISIRFPVPEISSRKEKDNFSSFTIFILVVYSELSLAPRLTDLLQLQTNNRRGSWKNAFPGNNVASISVLLLTLWIFIYFLYL